MTLADFGDPV